MTALGENGRTGYLLGGTAAVRSRSPKAASLLTAKRSFNSSTIRD